MDLAIEAGHLHRSYGRVVAVASLDLAVAAGTVLGLIGPNGAGKTTVIRLLTTVLRPDVGWFAVAGVPHTRPADVRRRVGVLPESAGYPPGETGEEWLTYHAELFGRRRRDARATARRLLAEVGLEARGGSLVAGYSRGLRQRLGIARALVNDPDVVFLDEPTLGLDPLGRHQVLELVTRIAREHGVTVVLSTHALDEVEQVCDHVLVLDRGRVVARGTVAEVAQRVAGPRRAVVVVPPPLPGRAVQVLEDDGLAARVRPAGHGEVEVRLAPGRPVETAAAEVLGRLLAAGVPVLGFALEGGRLSDAFRALTEEVS